MGLQKGGCQRVAVKLEHPRLNSPIVRSGVMRRKGGSTTTEGILEPSPTIFYNTLHHTGEYNKQMRI